MKQWVREQVARAYERLLRREGDGGPSHVAIIQDGNRRYAREQGDDASEGHRAGAETTEQVLEWCQDLGVKELTLYAFSTENFKRPPEEREHLYDLLEEKLTSIADHDRIHENEVAIRAIGETDRLPERVQESIRYAEERTADYGSFRLNVALAYGGRNELLRAARDVLEDVDGDDLDPAEIDIDLVDDRLYGRQVRDVDLIIRTGGDERTSNFLPWHANGNEAAAYFCAPYWPEFSKIDFLRGIRTYQSRERSWQRTRRERAAAIVRAVAETELAEARTVAGRLREKLPGTAVPEIDAELDANAGSAD
ncbi:MULTISPECIES: polyprenyl diphosphate synthase [Halolamina]|uniref:Tritrans,polycis-undecaprenyl-diphosphate synthase (geranylgeranyl-diphosphate specific) n=1 Tax=Halolamina pelagica TaxID=699431 RepID=A0A1I5QTP1_9EURY|nr:MULTISPECIES: polyprenyl diphosphate synthase [Halolamina]NHX35538.1 di-trans,poly-cis-decaprenylcistransferase [Halolamina sp. R1-12]SFP49639.1 tritrans,polycis-undecaprenyl-diphosphate synthase [geranylgeranyl-diphosphate specific] [Halolamina pelagica]